jgi:hypothetical protein
MEGKKYIGLKIINAYPMTKKEALERKLLRPGAKVEEEDGYYVRYKDGYESWAPKKAFEEAYKELDYKNYEFAISLFCGLVKNYTIEFLKEKE